MFKSLRSVIGGLGALAMGAVANGQTDVPRRCQVPLVAPTSSCDVANFLSWGGWYQISQHGGAWVGQGPHNPDCPSGGEIFPEFGFNEQIQLGWGLTPGDYPARYTDYARDSYPLVPSDAGAANSTLKPERPTAAGLVDLVTGQPLVQEEDFSLPFGGATFRHIRTNSTRHAINTNNYSDARNNFESGEWWDWQGYGWMMSESPMLLVDSAFGDVSHDRGRRCYFVPDAFHAIPFDFDKSTGWYSAPPRFGAGLSYDATVYHWTPDSNEPFEGGHWTKNGSPSAHGPETFDVWLDGGTLRYTFDVVYNDVYQTSKPGSSGQLLSGHTQPSEAVSGLEPPMEICDGQTNGFGIPYLGLLRQVADRGGNRVEIDYVSVHQFDGPTYAATVDDAEMKGCFQNTNARGQIARLRLTSLDPTTGSRFVAWSLLYVYRGFDDPLLRDYGDYARTYGQLTNPLELESVLVYRGDLPSNVAWQGGLTLPPSVFGVDAYGLEDLEANAAIDVVACLNGAAGGMTANHHIPTSWLIHARYTYTECKRLSGDQFQISTLLAASAPAGFEPRLIMRTVETKASETAGAPARTDVRQYRYVDPFHGTRAIVPGLELHWPYTPQLSYVYSDSTIRAILSGENAAGRPVTAQDLIAFPVSTEVSVIESAGSPAVSRHLGDLADLRLFRIDQRTLASSTTPSGHASEDFQFDPYAYGLVTSIGATTGVSNQWLSADALASELLVLQRGASGVASAFSVYQFVRGRDSGALVNGDACHRMSPDESDPNASTGFGRGTFHDPYRWNIGWESCAGSGQTPPADWNQPLWFHVTEEYASIDAALSLWPESNGGLQSRSSRHPTRRRVTAVNPAGCLLTSKEWTFDSSGNPQAGEQFGIGGSIGYDENYRVIWSQSPTALPDTATGGAPDRTNQGLVQLYEYAGNDANGKPSMEVISSSLKWGTASATIVPITQVEHHPSRRDLVTAEIQFGDGATQVRTDSFYEFFDESIPVADWKIKRKTIAKPSIVRDSSGITYRPTDREEYTESGQVVWHGHGLMKVTGPSDTHWRAAATTGDFFWVDYTAYDAQARVVAQVTDVNTSAPNTGLKQGSGPTVTVPTPPSAFVRQDPQPDAPLNECVKYEYGGLGLEKTHYPNGLSTVVTYEQEGAYLAERTFPAARLTETPFYSTPIQGKLRKLLGSQIVLEQVVVWQPDPNANGVIDASEMVVLADVTPQYDANGRIVEMKLTDQKTGEQLKKQQEADTFGEVSKDRSVAGGITRTERDYRGRPWRLYKGTLDGSRYWYGTPNDLGPDNMLLVEKYDYGVSDPRSCLQLTSTRRYTDDVATKYDRWNTAQDQTGAVELKSYDQRSRQVRTVRASTAGSTSTVISATHTYLDRLGRQVLVATYGATAPLDTTTTVANPANLGLADAPPNAGALLSASEGFDLISLTENIYDDANNLIETRSHNLTRSGGHFVNAGSNYTSTRTYTDGFGHTLSSVSPGGGVTEHLYDPRGREKYSKVIANGVEISRTIPSYDPDGRVTVTEQRERLHAAASSSLNDNITPRPYISTYSFNWYDEKGRLIATADLGTASGAFVTTSGTSPTRPEAILITDTSSNPYTEANSGTGQKRMTSPARDGAASRFAQNGTLPAGARITRYEYDKDGKQYRVIDDQTGAVTEQIFDGLGQVICKLEYPEADLAPNAVPDGTKPRRLTFQKYDKGRLIGMASMTPATPSRPLIKPGKAGMDDRWEGASKQIVIDTIDGVEQRADLQITLLLSKGDVLDSSGAKISEDPSLISSMTMPHGDGQTNTTVAFAYRNDGKLARRTDECGVVFNYSYDAIDRVSLIDVVYPWDSTSIGTLAPDRVGRVEYTYSPATLRLSSVLAKTKQDPASPEDPPSYVVANTAYDYDARGNLIKDAQEIGATVNSTTPLTEYTWAYASASGAGANFDRLESIIYPQRPGAISGSRRNVLFEYGANPSIEYYTNGITKVSTRPSNSGSFTEAASFKRTGAGRRVETLLGQYASVQRYFSPGSTDAGYAGLDQFGRPVTLEYKNTTASAAIQFAALYQYSSSGERTAARITQATLNGASHSNDRSWAYRYDYLGRLTGADTGSQTSSSDPSIMLTGGASPRLADWNMDALGNWTGNSVDSLGKKVRLDLFGTPDLETVSFDHATDVQNRIDTDTRVDGAGTSASKTFIYDAAGNLVSDGLYWYQYDGWGRIVQVDSIGTLGGFNNAGRPTTGASGGWRAHFTYDGLGRLVRRQSAMTPGDANTLIRTERYYHDGVRRIQEVFVDQLQSSGSGGTGGANNVGQENAQVPTATIYTNREYIWGPGDVHGLDEIISQIDRYSIAWYSLQDAGGDVVALVKPISQASGGSVGAQYSWSPAGELLAMDVNTAIANVPANRLGHRALFYDRFEATPTGPPLATDPTSLNEHGFYHCRNRVYSPWTGRFLQRDPNASGIAVLSHAARLGNSMDIGVADVSLTSLFEDGASLYGYVGGDPLRGRGDPMGLFFGLAAGLMTGLDMADMAQGMMDEALQGVLIRLELQEMLEEFFSVEDEAVDWTDNWSALDDAFDDAGDSITPMSPASFDHNVADRRGPGVRSPGTRRQPDPFQPGKVIPMPGGRKGGADTLRLNAKLRMKYEKKGWNHEQGLDLSEEHIKPSPSRQVPGSARNGKFVDLTFTKTRGKKKEWLRVQTVTTERGGKLTKSELAAAQRIRQAHPRDELHIYGKNTGRRIRNWNAR